MTENKIVTIAELDKEIERLELPLEETTERMRMKLDMLRLWKSSQLAMLEEIDKLLILFKNEDWDCYVSHSCEHSPYWYLKELKQSLGGG